MNIVYATRATIPYASAASLNSVQMCESLVQLGHRVILALGRKVWRRRSSEGDWASFYGFEPRFEIARGWELPKTGYGFDGWIIRLALRHQALLYLRFTRLLAHRAARRVPTILELHSSLTPGERRLVAGALLDGSLRGVVAITAVLRDHLLQSDELALFADRILVAPDAVNCDRFAHVDGALDLSRAGYVGSLYPGKGMERIAQIAALRPDVDFDVIGGPPSHVAQWRRATGSQANLKLHGHLPPADVPGCFGRFGIALLPNQPSIRLPNGDDIGRFTSPMKLFEYMAAGRAIIASNLPGLREVLTHDVNSLLVPHDDPTAWAQAIDQLRRQPECAQRLAAQAKREAQSRYSYTQRFRAILDHFVGSSVVERCA
jgi:glycosyltransferase involved in cell wall biosynthesis